MENRKRKSTSAPETDGDEEELVLTIKIPKAFAGEFKARRDEVTEVTQKAMLEVLTKHDMTDGDEEVLVLPPIKIPKGGETPNGETPNGDNRQAAPPSGEEDLNKHDILSYYTGSQTPNGDYIPALPR